MYVCISVLSRPLDYRRAIIKHISADVLDPGLILWRATLFSSSFFFLSLFQLDFSPGMGSIHGRAHFFPITLFFPLFYTSLFSSLFHPFLPSNFFLPFSLPSFLFSFSILFPIPFVPPHSFSSFILFPFFLPLSPGFLFSLSSLYFILLVSCSFSLSCCFYFFVFFLLAPQSFPIYYTTLPRGLLTIK